MNESLFGRMVRHSKGHSKGGNDVTFHSVWNGRQWLTVPSYSTADPFAPIGTEAKRIEGSKPRSPVTEGDRAGMRTLAARVRESYGDAAVGDIP